MDELIHLKESLRKTQAKNKRLKRLLGYYRKNQKFLKKAMLSFPGNAYLYTKKGNLRLASHQTLRHIRKFFPGYCLGDNFYPILPYHTKTYDAQLLKSKEKYLSYQENVDPGHRDNSWLTNKAAFCHDDEYYIVGVSLQINDVLKNEIRKFIQKINTKYIIIKLNVK